MLRFFWRIFRASYSLHLLLPLAVSVALGGVIGYFRGDVRNTRQLLHYLVSERVMDLAAIYVVFIIVVLLLVSQSAELRIANLGLLDDILPKSTAYFALAPTPLREWFDPSIQVYLARIAAQQRTDPNFHHVRVL